MENVDGLKNELKNHGKTVFLDCVGGNVAGQIFNVLPPNSVMVNYGRLSK
jgi:NADPH:quinone reductase-like Zn-dependent oxidoreductase